MCLSIFSLGLCTTWGPRPTPFPHSRVSFFNSLRTLSNSITFLHTHSLYSLTLSSENPASLTSLSPLALYTLHKRCSNTDLTSQSHSNEFYRKCSTTPNHHAITLSVSFLFYISLPQPPCRLSHLHKQGTVVRLRSSPSLSSMADDHWTNVPHDIMSSENLALGLVPDISTGMALGSWSSSTVEIVRHGSHHFLWRWVSIILCVISLRGLNWFLGLMSEVWTGFMIEMAREEVFQISGKLGTVVIRPLSGHFFGQHRPLLNLTLVCFCSLHFKLQNGFWIIDFGGESSLIGALEVGQKTAKCRPLRGRRVHGYS